MCQSGVPDVHRLLPTLLCLLILPVSAAADAPAGAVVTLDEHSSSASLSVGARLLKDPQGELSAAAALRQLREQPDRVVETTYPSFGFNRGNLWLLTSVSHRHPDQQNWVLQVGRPHISELDLWVFDARGTPVTQLQHGDSIPYHQRPYPHASLVFPLSLAAGETYQLLFRASSQGSIELPTRLFTPDAFALHDRSWSLRAGSYYGAMLAMVLFNLLLFMAIRDRSYLMYVLYLSSLAMFLMIRDGLALEVLWPTQPALNQQALTIMPYLAIGFFVLFVTDFLQLTDDGIRWRKALRGGAWITMAFGILTLTPALPSDEAMTLSTALAPVWLLLTLAVILWRQLAGYRPALYLMVSFLPLAILVALFSLKTLQLISGSWLIDHGLHLGSALSAFLLSFALAYRLTNLKAENEKMQLEANEALEKRVLERTSELNEALSARSEFLAVMSHEIRTPLNGIIGTVDMLRDSGLNEAQLRQVHIIEQSGQSLLQLINDVLDYARIEAGKMPIEETHFDLQALISDSVELFSHKARLNNNTMDCELESDLGRYAIGDPMRVRQVLVNLVSNAVKFTENGRITVRASRDRANPEYVRFAVEDTGIGIDRDKLEDLFEHFHQIDSSTSRRYGGTGLGLAISRQLVEVMGGEIGVRSENRDGSCFWFRLPLPTKDEQSFREEQDGGEEALAPARLLIVDDNHINLMVAEGLCRKLGHDVEIAESGMEAIAVLMDGARTFDLIMMDCEMPEMDGFETARQIITMQEEGRLDRTPIVALTAHAVPDKIRACHEAGMISHIAKPVTRDKLSRELTTILGHFRRNSDDSLAAE